MKKFLMGLLAVIFIAGTTFAQTQKPDEKKVAAPTSKVKVEKKEAVKAAENKEAAAKQSAKHEVKAAKEEVKAAKKEVKSEKKEVKAEKKMVKETAKQAAPTPKK